MNTYKHGSERHGGEVYALAEAMHCREDNLLDFSSNANIFAADITEKLVSSIPYPFLHYPDSRAARLTKAIAAHEKIDQDRIIAGNGAADLIWLVLYGLAPQRVLFIGPVFSEYISACEAYGIPYDIVTPGAENSFICTAQDLDKVWNSSADLVVMCTPNNPSGAVYPNMEGMLKRIRSPRVLIDNSYREFLYPPAPEGGYAENAHSAYEKAARPGVSILTLHSFTKFFCCPGIRLGYLMGDKLQLNRLDGKRPSWTVSPFAQEMGIAFLEHIDLYRERLPDLYAAVESMGMMLRRAGCFNPDNIFEGPGFLCCGLAPGYSAGQIWKHLLKLRIVVRDCDSIPGMPPGFIRVQARPEEDAQRLIKALEGI